MTLFALLYQTNCGRSSYGNVALFIFRGDTKFLAFSIYINGLLRIYTAVISKYFGFVLPYSTLPVDKIEDFFQSVNKYRQVSSCPFAFVCLGH